MLGFAGGLGVCLGFGGLEEFEASRTSSNGGIGKDPIYVKGYHCY